MFWHQPSSFLLLQLPPIFHRRGRCNRTSRILSALPHPCSTRGAKWACLSSDAAIVKFQPFPFCAPGDSPKTTVASSSLGPSPVQSFTCALTTFHYAISEPFPLTTAWRVTCPPQEALHESSWQRGKGLRIRASQPAAAHSHGASQPQFGV